MVPINRVTALLLKRRDEVEQLDMKGKMRWVWKMLVKNNIRELLEIETLWEKPSLKKCLEKAENLKKIGNNEFASRNLYKSLQAYNEALCYAPVNDSDNNTFAVILANRSQVLCEMGYFKLALLDIKLSKDSGYPAKLIYKLWAREGVCLHALGKAEDAKKCFEKAKDSLTFLGLDTAAKNHAMAFIKQKELEASEPNFEIGQAIRLSEKETPKLRNAHSKYPSFTAKVDVKWTQTQGRHVLAKSIIKPGEMIAVDTAVQ